MYLVVSVRLSVRLSVCPSALSRLNKNHYQSKVFACVSLISRRTRIIALMQSIGF